MYTSASMLYFVLTTKTSRSLKSIRKPDENRIFPEKNSDNRTDKHHKICLNIPVQFQ